MTLNLEKSKFTVRVQFVHSAHDQKPRFTVGQTGRLRQFADNLAYSLRRRVTLCEIDAFAHEDAPSGSQTGVSGSFIPVAQGFALCHFNDQFVKSEGRIRALKRALAILGPLGVPKEDRAQIAEACGFNYEDVLAV